MQDWWRQGGGGREGGWRQAGTGGESHRGRNHPQHAQRCTTCASCSVLLLLTLLLPLRRNPPGAAAKPACTALQDTRLLLNPPAAVASLSRTLPRKAACLNCMHPPVNTCPGPGRAPTGRWCCRCRRRGTGLRSRRTAAAPQGGGSEQRRDAAGRQGAVLGVRCTGQALSARHGLAQHQHPCRTHAKSRAAAAAAAAAAGCLRRRWLHLRGKRGDRPPPAALMLTSRHSPAAVA